MDELVMTVPATSRWTLGLPRRGPDEGMASRLRAVVAPAHGSEPRGRSVASAAPERVSSALDLYDGLGRARAAQLLAERPRRGLRLSGSGSFRGERRRQRGRGR
jgi:hypothetical protein